MIVIVLYGGHFAPDFHHDYYHHHRQHLDRYQGHDSHRKKVLLTAAISLLLFPFEVDGYRKIGICNIHNQDQDDGGDDVEKRIDIQW